MSLRDADTCICRVQMIPLGVYLLMCMITPRSKSRHIIHLEHSSYMSRRCSLLFHISSSWHCLTIFQGLKPPTVTDGSITGEAGPSSSGVKGTETHTVRLSRSTVDISLVDYIAVAISI